LAALDGGVAVLAGSVECLLGVDGRVSALASEDFAKAGAKPLPEPPSGRAGVMTDADVLAVPTRSGSGFRLSRGGRDDSLGEPAGEGTIEAALHAPGIGLSGCRCSEDVARATGRGLASDIGRDDESASESLERDEADDCDKGAAGTAGCELTGEAAVAGTDKARPLAVAPGPGEAPSDIPGTAPPAAV